jgi:hypothetical protein
MQNFTIITGEKQTFKPNIVMSLIMCISTQEGFALAGDSIEMFNVDGSNYEYSFDHSRKVFVTPSNVGILTCGNSTIQSENIHIAMDEFIDQHANANVEQLASAISPHFRHLRPDIDTSFILAGYINGKRTMFRVNTETDSLEKYDKHNGYNTGALWNGQTDPISRLITQSYFKNDDGTFEEYSRRSIPWSNYCLQDAIDVLRYLFEVTIGYYHFTKSLPKVSKPIDILTITKQGHQWIQKKELH